MNPSIYEVNDDNLEFSMSKTNLDLYHMHTVRKEKMYASFFRPGDVWTEEVFVCPNCAHATLIGEPGEEAEEEYENEFYCKYCYTDWKHTIKGWEKKTDNK